jgi:hypothetical protein
VRTLSLFGGPYSPVIVAFTLLLTGIAGAMVGANEAAAGGEPVDLFELLHEDMFTDDGELREREPPETQPEAFRDFNERVEQATPETPRMDRWLSQHLVKPLVLAAFHVADAGFRIGYAMATTLGFGVTRLLLNGAVAGMIAVTALHSFLVTRRVSR